METTSNDQVEKTQVTKRKRGNTRGAKWKKIRDQKEEPVEIQIPSCLQRAVGENAQQFITETSYMVKQFLPLNAKKWHDINKDARSKLMSKVKEMYVFPNGAHVTTAIRKMLMKHYRNWRYGLRSIALKYNTNQERLSHCPKQVDPEDWKWLVEVHWDSKEFRHKSEVNRQNRKKQKMLACVGTKSLVRTLHEMRNDENDRADQRPEYIKFWLKQRKMKEGLWVDDEAEEGYKKMEELHAAQMAQFGVDKLTTVEAYTEVFGPRSGHVRGMGEGPPPLKIVKQHVSHDSCVNEADINGRIQAEVKQKLEEHSKQKDEDMAKRLEEFSKTREQEIRKQVQAEWEDKMSTMASQLALLMDSHSSTSRNQSSSPPQETMHEISNQTKKDQPLSASQGNVDAVSNTKDKVQSKNQLLSASQGTMREISSTKGKDQSKNQLLSASQGTMRAISNTKGKDQFCKSCPCGEKFTDAGVYMVHVRQIDCLNKPAEIPSTNQALNRFQVQSYGLTIGIL